VVLRGLEPTLLQRVREVVVLQLALPGLVADRTVDGMIEQDELENGAPELFDVVGVRRVLGVLGDTDIAGRDGLRAVRGVHQAHAAVGRPREPRVVAEVRHLETGRPRCFEHGGPGLDGDRLPVDFAVDGHQRSHSPPIMLTEPKVGTMSAT
jgi:hypothetical protein